MLSYFDHEYEYSLSVSNPADRIAVPDVDRHDVRACFKSRTVESPSRRTDRHRASELALSVTSRESLSATGPECSRRCCFRRMAPEYRRPGRDGGRVSFGPLSESLFCPSIAKVCCMSILCSRKWVCAQFDSRARDRATETGDTRPCVSTRAGAGCFGRVR